MKQRGQRPVLRQRQSPLAAAGAGAAAAAGAGAAAAAGAGAAAAAAAAVRGGRARREGAPSVPPGALRARVRMPVSRKLRLQGHAHPPPTATSRANPSPHRALSSTGRGYRPSGSRSCVAIAASVEQCGAQPCRGFRHSSGQRAPALRIRSGFPVRSASGPARGGGLGVHLRRKLGHGPQGHRWPGRQDLRSIAPLSWEPAKLAEALSHPSRPEPGSASRALSKWAAGHSRSSPRPMVMDPGAPEDLPMYPPN